MKKISLLFVIACVTLIALPSCKKQEQEKPAITQTVNTTVKVNETYSYVLPANDSHEPYTVVKQSQHASTSFIEKNADGNFVYNYTPTADFAGSDMVIISNEKEGNGQCMTHHEHHGRHHHHGNCSHHGEGMQKHIITINFTIGAGVANATSTKLNNK